MLCGGVAACHWYGVCTVGCVLFCFSGFFKAIEVSLFPLSVFSDVLINNMHSELGETRNV